MPIEAYAIVVFDVTSPISKEENEYMRQMEFYPGSMTVARNTEFHFCKIRLVQPAGKEGSVPKPKWEVVADYATYPIRTWDVKTTYVERLMTRSMLEKLSPNDAYNDVTTIERRDGVRFCVPDYTSQWSEFFRISGHCGKICERPKEKHIYFPLHHPIDDRRIQLKQIRFLFPETVKMPLAFALDYIRDRM